MRKKIFAILFLITICFVIAKAQNEDIILTQDEIVALNNAIDSHPTFSKLAKHYEEGKLQSMFERYKRDCYKADSSWSTNQANLEKFENIGVTEKFEFIPLSEYYTANDSLIGESGVSYLIKTDDVNILFDVGENMQRVHPSPLLKNMHRLGVTIEDIDIIVISHNHGDHIGRAWENKGTFSLGNYQVDLGSISVYVPNKMNYPGISPKFIPNPTRLAKGVATIGVIQNPSFFVDIKEQALAINVKDKGIIVISGCGHQSMSKILDRTDLLFDEPLYGVLGGYHYPVEIGRNIKQVYKYFAVNTLPWVDYTIDRVFDDIKLLKTKDIKLVGISAHDSCDKSISAYKDEFGSAYSDIKVGLKISLNE